MAHLYKDRENGANTVGDVTGSRNYLETNEQANFERTLLGKRDLKAFHMECPVTKKLICRCEYSNTPLE